MAGDVRGVEQVAGTNDNVGLAIEDRLDELGELFGAMLSISVDGDDNLGLVGLGELKASRQGSAFASVARQAKDFGAGGMGQLGGGIAGAIVNHNHPAGLAARFQDGAGNEAFFIVGWNDGDDIVRLRGGDTSRCIRGHLDLGWEGGSLGYEIVSLHGRLPLDVLRPSDIAEQIQIEFTMLDLAKFGV